MKNYVFSVTHSDLNTYDEVVFDVLMSVTGRHIPTGEIEVEEELYPGQVVLSNRTGAVVGYNFFSSEEEYEEYQERPQYFDFIPMTNGEIVNSGSIGRVKKMIFKKESGVAVENLNVKCINYRKI